MVTFTNTAGGCEVLVNEKMFGHISREHGFFTGPTSVQQFVEVSADDLRRIADEAENVRNRKW